MKTSLSALLVIIAACLARTTTAQVALINDRFDYPNKVFEITLRNTGPTTVRLIELENDCLYFREILVDTMQGPEPKTLKPVARYRFRNQDVKRMPASPVLELKPGEAVKITAGITFQYMGEFEYVGRIIAKFNTGDPVRTRPYALQSRPAPDELPLLSRAALIDSVRSSSSGGCRFIGQMVNHTWAAEEAAALLRPCTVRPEARPEALRVTGTLGLLPLKAFVKTLWFSEPDLREIAGMAFFQVWGSEATELVWTQYDSLFRKIMLTPPPGFEPDYEVDFLNFLNFYDKEILQTRHKALLAQCNLNRPQWIESLRRGLADDRQAVRDFCASQVGVFRITELKAAVIRLANSNRDPNRFASRAWGQFDK